MAVEESSGSWSSEAIQSLFLTACSSLVTMGLEGVG